jgi:hypothetical protein
MGCRNPFRFTVDKRGWVYWGDVGPDSGVDSLRGPQSYDEFNQARESGYFGWPYFVADNKAYPDYDFSTNTILKEYQNPLKPVNHSPNNTGKTELPPTQKPMIWYPYGPSEEFPMLGTGSRSACAGRSTTRPISSGHPTSSRRTTTTACSSTNGPAAGLRPWPFDRDGQHDQDRRLPARHAFLKAH